MLAAERGMTAVCDYLVSRGADVTAIDQTGTIHTVVERFSKRCIETVKAAHSRLPSVGFRSWSRFLAVSL